MELLSGLFGVLACAAPVIALVAYMAWATRLPRCQACHHRLAHGGTKCPQCGAERAKPP